MARQRRKPGELNNPALDIEGQGEENKQLDNEVKEEPRKEEKEKEKELHPEINNESVNKTVEEIMKEFEIEEEKRGKEKKYHEEHDKMTFHIHQSIRDDLQIYVESQDKKGFKSRFLNSIIFNSLKEKQGEIKAHKQKTMELYGYPQWIPLFKKKFKNFPLYSNTKASKYFKEIWDNGQEHEFYLIKEEKIDELIGEKKK